MVTDTCSMYAVNRGVNRVNPVVTVKPKTTAKPGIYTALVMAACLIPGVVQGGSLVKVPGELQPLTLQQMAAISGGTLINVPVPDESRAGGDLAMETLGTVAKTLLPVLMVLESDTTVSGVHFAADVAIQVRYDGALMLPVPSRIEQIRMENLRVGNGNSMGSITFHNLRFHPDSRLTISAR